MNVDFDPRRERGTIEGLSRIQFTNPHSEPLSDIVLMLWPNDRQYRAEAQAGPALIDGHLVLGQPELDGLAVRYDLPGTARARSDPGHERAVQRLYRRPD